jgi:hypothetical protein
MWVYLLKYMYNRRASRSFFPRSGKINFPAIDGKTIKGNPFWRWTLNLKGKEQYQPVGGAHAYFPFVARKTISQNISKDFLSKSSLIQEWFWVNLFWANPFWANPFWANPFWENPFWANPFWANPFWANPFWANPFWANPFWANPFWANPVWNKNDSE